MGLSRVRERTFQMARVVSAKFCGRDIWKKKKNWKSLELDGTQRLGRKPRT